MKRSIVAMLLSLVISGFIQAETITVSHALGETTLETNPERIVVTGMGVLDAVDYFGIIPVAVTKAPMLPDYLAKYKGNQFASSGTLQEPDFETIYMQKPDLIIIGPRAMTSYQELSKIAPTIVFAVDSKEYWESTQMQWRMLGEVFEIQTKVEEKIASVEQKINKIKNYNQEHNTAALTVMSSGGNITTFGLHSRFSVIYNDFGFKEAAEGIKESTHGNLVSYEYIRNINPTNLLIIDRDKLLNKDNNSTREAFDNPLVKSTDAYKNGKITYLDLGAWYLAIAGVTATDQMIADIKQAINLN